MGCGKKSGQIFISYRREDASYPAGRLYDRLSAHFPQNQIFIDVDTIEPGIDFVKALEESVGACDVLTAVIGKRRLMSCDQEGKRQLESPEDFVHIEIATALKRDIRVIPGNRNGGFDRVSPACFPVIEMAGLRSAPSSDPAVEMAGFAGRS